MTKVTFTLDAGTIEAIRTIAVRRQKPRSQVVREAVAAYARAEVTLDAPERERRIRVLDGLAARPRSRPQTEVDRELRGIRRGRRSGWRRPSD